MISERCLVPAAGVEPATFRSGGERSNPLSYAGNTGLREKITQQRVGFYLAALDDLRAHLVCGLRREVKDQANDPERHGSDQACRRDGEYPGPDDSSGHTPLDRGKPARGSDPDNGAGDCMRG